MPGKMREIPYRGQVHPKQRGHPSPPKPFQKVVNQIFWVIFIVVGVIIFGFALKYLFINRNAGGFFVFAIYLMFLLIAIFAFRDAQSIETIKSDQETEKDKDSDDPAMLDDYLAQINWKQNHRRNHPDEPRWRYQTVSTKSKSKDFGFFIALLFIIPILIVAYFYGAKSPVTIIAAVVLGFVEIFAFLIYQNSRS